MITILILLTCSLIFAILAGIFNAFTDTCECKPYYDKSIFAKYPENVFYKGKSDIWKWYPGTTDVERFFGSSKWFVAITDFWHWSELWEVMSLLISASFGIIALFQLINYWSIPVVALGVYIVSSTVFDYLFHKGLKENKVLEILFVKPFLWMHNIIFKKIQL